VFKIPKKKAFGYIYLVTNSKNDKVYVGQTQKNKCKERWKEHLREAVRATETGEIRGCRYLNYAIAHYGSEVWDVRKIDTAYSLSELNEKEDFWIKKYDSTNSDKGYNLREGGDGSFVNQETIELLREANIRQFSDLENIKRHSEITKEMWNNKEYREKQEIARNSSKFKERMREVGAEKWERLEYRKKMEKIMKSKEYLKKQKISQEKRWNVPGAKEEQRKRAKNQWEDPEIRKKHLEARSDPDFKKRQSEAMKGNRNAYKEIKDEEEFLKDIKNGMWLKDVAQKYGMSDATIRERIREFFGPNGPQTFRKLKEYLKDKDMDDVLKELKNEVSKSQEEKENLENKFDTSKEINKREDEDQLAEEKSKENDEEFREESKKGPEKQKETEKEEKNEITIEKHLEDSMGDVSERVEGELSKELVNESKEQILKNSEKNPQNFSDFIDNMLVSPMEERKEFNDVFDGPVEEKEEFKDVLDGSVEEKEEFKDVLESSIEERSDFVGISKDNKEKGNDSDGTNDIPDDQRSGGELYFK